MIIVNDLSLNFSGQTLFKHVDLKFTPGNCYGIIGANGAGKTTFLRILSGELEPSSGEVIIPDNERMSVLKQDHFQYDEYTVLDTVILGNPRLYEVEREKNALYEKPDFSDEDGVRASELEAEYAEMGGWEAESDASRLIQGLGLSESILHDQMSSLSAKEKVKVLLAQALFGKPDIILLDEPTNHLDLPAIEWLEDFLMDYEGLVLVVSHDRYFLNTVCTGIVDVDYGGIKMYVGNYDFWYRVQPADAAAHPGPEPQARRIRSRNCRSSSPASPPTSPRASRPPPAGSSWRRLAVEEMPAVLPPLPLRGLHHGPGARQGDPHRGAPRQDRGWPQGPGQRLLPGEQGRQDRLRGGG